MITSHRTIHVFILLVATLICLITGCSTPETTTEVSELVGAAVETPATSPTEFSTVTPAQEFNQTNGFSGTATVAVDSSPTSEVTAASETLVSTLDVTEEQETQFLNLVGGVLTGARHFHPDLYDELAGMILVGQSMQSGILNMLNTSSDSFAEKIQPLLDYIEQLTPEEQAQLAQAIIQSYHLNTGEDGAVLVNLASSFATVEYDGASGVTQLAIPTTDSRELALAEDYHDLISVNARTLNPQTLEEEVAIVPVLAARVESLDHLIYDQQVVLELPGMILAWTDITFNPGAFTDASGDRLFGRFFHTAGLSGADAVMGLRPLGISNPDIFHPLLYGGAEPQPMPEHTGSELENAMATDLQAALALAVQDGSITQERAQEFQERFDDADLIAVAPSPVFRAGALIAASVPETGGDFVLDVLLGNNGTGHPILLYFGDDPALVDIFAEEGEAIPDLSEEVGLLYPRKNGSYFLILDKRFSNGREPAEVIATYIPHEVIAHESLGVSIDEEVLGNLAQSLTWARLVERDPALLAQRTALTLGRNSDLFLLLNSVYSDHTGSYVGILSQHVEPDWNIAPGGNLSFIRFKDLMEKFHYDDNELDSTAPGSKVIERLILAMFGDDPEVREEVVAESMGNTFSLYLDSHTRFLLTNERALNLAKLLGLEVTSQN